MLNQNLVNQFFLDNKLNNYKDYNEHIYHNEHKKIFQKWYDDQRNERKIQSDFLNDIFGIILGYEYNTDKEEYNLEKEQTTDKIENQ